MKTIVYLDGYNLYYGRLIQTAYKWLDVATLFRSIIEMQDKASEVIGIKLFTAPALARFARREQDSVIARSSAGRRFR